MRRSALHLFFWFWFVLIQQAIAAYRSQTTNLIDDDPNGFRLTAEMLENFAQPWEIYLEESY